MADPKITSSVRAGLEQALKGIGSSYIWARVKVGLDHVNAQDIRLGEFRAALADYHRALDLRMNGDVAANKFIQAAEGILQMRRGA